MPSKTTYTYTTNPFASPTKDANSSTPSIVVDTDVSPQLAQPAILTTANLLLNQLKELEDLCSTVEARVQRKRQSLKALEKLVAGSAAAATTTTETHPSSPAFSANTPISRRLRFKSPRLRGLFDLRGPGKVNPGTLQSTLDYSPEPHAPSPMTTNSDARVSVGDKVVQAGEEPEEWEDDNDEAPLCPFDDKYAIQGSQSPLEVEKALPPVPVDSEKDKGQTTKIPKLYLKRRVSTSKHLTTGSRSVARVPSNKRRPSTRRAKSRVEPFGASPKNPRNKGTERRGSGRRGILENVKTKSGTKASRINENVDVTQSMESTRRKEKRKGLWSIYSVYSELGLSGSHHAVSG